MRKEAPMRKVLSKFLYYASIIIGSASFLFGFLAQAGPDIGIRFSSRAIPFFVALILSLTAVVCIILSYRLRVVE
jgi:hypothetical protein